MSARRIAVSLALLGFVLASTTTTAASRGDSLLRTFPAIRGHVTPGLRFEPASWRHGPRTVAAFQVRSAASGAAGNEHAAVALPALASDPVLVEGEGVRVVLRAVGARGVRAQREPGALLYRDVSADTDVWHVPRGEWTEEYLHLRSRRAPRVFEYEILETAGATEVRVDDRHVRFLAPDGHGLVALAPVVVDSAGRRSPTAARWEISPPDARGTRHLKLLLDPAGLEYPLLVDPTWITTGSMATARSDGIGILLHTGNVLVMAGAPDTQTTAELYDPATGAWSPAPDMPGPGRGSFAAVLLRDGRVLVAGGSQAGVSTSTCRLYDPTSNTWALAASMGSPRQSLTLTLLQDGRALAVGGESPLNVALRSAELYDPLAGTWTPTGSLLVPKTDHQAARLRDGRVLVAGGVTPSDTRISEIYDPATGAWSRVGDTVSTHDDASLTLLPDGRVLAAGGWSQDQAEVFDPGSLTWTATNPLSGPRQLASATLLPNGRVIVAGGVGSTVSSSTELYDYTTGAWAPGPVLSVGRYRHSATMLPNGRLLLAGGFNAGNLTTAELLDVDDLAAGWTTGPNMSTVRREHSISLLEGGKVLAAGGVSSNTAETWDPGSNAWTPTANPMFAPRWRHTATVLVDGRVLVAGTISGVAQGRTAEVYDPATDRWTRTGDMTTVRYSHAAALLPCGEVLVVGGESSSGVVLRSAERYNPHTGTFRPTGSLGTGRWAHTATLLKNGRVLVTGGWNGGTLASAEIYDPQNETWTPTNGPMVQPRYHHRATLLPSGKVLITGGMFVTSAAEIFDPATGTFALAAPLGFARDDTFTTTLLPNGKVLVTGSFASPSRAELFDPVDTALGTWTTTADMNPSRYGHAAVLLLDGRVMVTGGDGGGTTSFYNVGRGELPGWRPVLSGATSPLVAGSPFVATGNAFTGLGEGSTGFGSMHSATNYPLVQLRRLDNGFVTWLPVDPTVGWSSTGFRSLPVNGFAPGPALATVFTNGIPSLSRTLTVECPPPAITTDPVSQTVCEGTPVSFSVASSGDCASHEWWKDGTQVVDGGIYSGAQTPTLGLTGTTVAAAGSYQAVAWLACSTTPAASAPAVLTVIPALGAVDASITGPTTVCTSCLGGTANEVHAGGGTVAYQWGYRSVSGGAITDIPWATGPTYVLNGADFPGEGNYLVVVRLTPTCGTVQVSDEVSVKVSNAAPALDEVPFFTVTSTDSSNLLEWVYPAAYNTVRIRYTTAATATSCSFPADANTAGTLLTTQTGVAGGRGSFTHNDASVTNDTTYCYTVFVDKGGGTWSLGRTNHGRPFATGAQVKWAFSSGGFSTTPPTVGGAGVIATNNDNAVHAMARGELGGQWPAGWRPVRVGGAVQGRCPVVPITVNLSSTVVFVGAQDGRVYAVDARFGDAAPAAPWPAGPALVGGVVQAAPAGVFTAFGSGGYDDLLVGTRDAGADNAFVALRPGDGSEAGRYAPLADPDRIGIVSGAASVEYTTPPRVYFTSRMRDTVNKRTLWCLAVDASGGLTLVWPRDDLGDIDSSPVVRADRVYVGSAVSKGTLFSLDSVTGGDERRFVHSDGQVKSFVFPDRYSPTGDLVFSTDTRVWVVSDGTALTPRWANGIALPGGATPSAPLLLRGLSSPTSQHVFVGASDGRLYQLEVSTGTLDVRSVPLGDGTSIVGAPSYDLDNGLVHVGTAAGVFYAVRVPLP